VEPQSPRMASRHHLLRSAKPRNDPRSRRVTRSLTSLFPNHRMNSPKSCRRNNCRPSSRPWKNRCLRNSRSSCCCSNGIWAARCPSGCSAEMQALVAFSGSCPAAAPASPEYPFPAAHTMDGLPPVGWWSCATVEPDRHGLARPACCVHLWMASIADFSPAVQSANAARKCWGW
jgi:hypothetical protein